MMLAFYTTDGCRLCLPSSAVPDDLNDDLNGRLVGFATREGRAL